MSNPQRTDDGPAMARALLRLAGVATCGTLDRRSGHPYVSLVTVATLADGTPVCLLSRLAQHTRNLEADQRASLLLAHGAEHGDPLARPRLTLVGDAARATGPVERAARSRFLARHPGAARYADFADFAFWSLAIVRAHLVAGFGRIEEIAPERLLTPTTQTLTQMETATLAEINRSFAAALERHAGAPAAAASPWCAIGIDSDGLDLMAGSDVARLRFVEPCSTPEAVLDAVANGRLCSVTLAG